MARSHRRVAIERIAGDAARQVSFSKRRQGLFKKVCELSTLCGAESAVLVHSPAGRVYSLGDPDVITIVDRFLEYASQSDAAAESGTSSQQREGGGGRRPQQPRRGAAPQEVRRRVVEEELYRQLADQDSWCEEAKVYRSVLAADMKDKEERLLPQRWAAKVQELSLQESEEMADALEELALRIGDWIREKEEEEGVPPAQRWSPDDPAPPPTNPWRQAAFLASLGAHAAPWGAAANLAPMAGGINVPYAAPPDMRALAASPAPLNLAMSGAIAAPEAPPMGAAMLPVAENPVAPGFMAARFPGMGGPTGATVGADPYGFVASSSSAAHPVTAQLMQARRDGGGSSTGLGPGSRFY